LIDLAEEIVGEFVHGMSFRQLEFSRQAARLQAYLDGLTEATGHADRRVPMENYTEGLMLPIERKASSRWRHVWHPATYARCTSRCITWLPMQPGAMTRI